MNIEELFQRERNETRSDHDISRYLKDPGDLKFFNSVTVALLPLRKNRNTGKAELSKTYDDDSYFGDKPRGLDGEDIGVGQVSIYLHPEDPSQGFISWDDARTLPVVLDGQHRLASLKHVINSDKPFPGKHELEHSRLSVLLLVLDERAGFHDPQKRGLMAACRTVFTDLNKNAVSVSRARQYLLDEADVHASALRAVLAQGVSTAPNGTVLERARSEHRLPLALVDWRGEKAKFDSGPYITTILALFPAVESIIGIKKPSEDDYEEQRGYINRLTSRMLGSAEAVEMKSLLLERIEKAESHELPFALTNDEVHALATGFRQRFGQRIVRVLTEFAPYKRLIDAYSEAGFFNSALEAWFSLDGSAREALISEFNIIDPAPKVEKIASSVKGGANGSTVLDLSFQVVFQRALIIACDLFVTFGAEIAEELILNSTDEGALIDEFIERANSRLAPGLALGASVKSPFVGAGVRVDGTIDFRKTRVAGIAGFMFYALVAPDAVFDSSLSSKKRDTEAKSWIEDKWDEISRGPKVGMAKLYSAQGSAWRRGLLDVVNARDSEVEDTNAAMVELGVSQLNALVRAAK